MVGIDGLDDDVQRFDVPVHPSQYVQVRQLIDNLVQHHPELFGWQFGQLPALSLQIRLQSDCSIDGIFSPACVHTHQVGNVVLFPMILLYEILLGNQKLS